MVRVRRAGAAGHRVRRRPRPGRPPVRHGRSRHDRARDRRHRQTPVAVRLLAGRRAGVLGRPAGRRPAGRRDRVLARPAAASGLVHPAAGRLAGDRPPPRPGRGARTSSSCSPGTSPTGPGPGRATSGSTAPTPGRPSATTTPPGSTTPSRWPATSAPPVRIWRPATRSFHRALFGSTLPPEVVDAVSATLVALRSTTCFRLADGRFAAWEGSFDHSGSCEGTCTHVWNYAQTAAYLFPGAGARTPGAPSSSTRRVPTGG